MEVQNNEIAPVDEDVRKAKQGKVTGVIIPPPDIRAVVDKTAKFVLYTVVIPYHLIRN